jgi:mutator protein MutT
MAKIVCAGFVDNGKILLVRRAPHRKWSANLWDLVGGHVDKGEGLDEALVRECEEEVGLTPLSFNKVAILYESKDDKQKSPFHIYAVPLWKGERALLLGTEHSELGWFVREDLAAMELAMPEYRPVILQILDASLSNLSG